MAQLHTSPKMVSIEPVTKYSTSPNAITFMDQKICSRRGSETTFHHPTHTKYPKWKRRGKSGCKLVMHSVPKMVDGKDEQCLHRPQQTLSPLNPFTQKARAKREPRNWSRRPPFLAQTVTPRNSATTRIGR
jgi:hypothetical protein